MRRLKDLNVEVSKPAMMYYYNLRRIQLTKNPIFHAWTKHIDLHYHFFRERVLSSEVELRYVSTNRQVANIFNKQLAWYIAPQISRMLGIQHLDMPNLRGRRERERERDEVVRKDESDVEFISR